MKIHTFSNTITLLFIGMVFKELFDDILVGISPEPLLVNVLTISCPICETSYNNKDRRKITSNDHYYFLK
ncbi:MAG: hypothetical protein EBX50_21430 [Chitinophagia bacterium]|nr:hypothetical protein [Chitinophagia bacterium]